MNGFLGTDARYGHLVADALAAVEEAKGAKPIAARDATLYHRMSLPFEEQSPASVSRLAYYQQRFVDISKQTSDESGASGDDGLSVISNVTVATGRNLVDDGSTSATQPLLATLATYTHADTLKVGAIDATRNAAPTPITLDRSFLMTGSESVASHATDLDGGNLFGPSAMDGSIDVTQSDACSALDITARAIERHAEGMREIEAALARQSDTLARIRAISRRGLGTQAVANHFAAVDSKVGAGKLRDEAGEAAPPMPVCEASPNADLAADTQPRELFVPSVPRSPSDAKGGKSLAPARDIPAPTTPERRPLDASFSESRATLKRAVALLDKLVALGSAMPATSAASYVPVGRAKPGNPSATQRALSPSSHGRLPCTPSHAATANGNEETHAISTPAHSATLRLADLRRSPAGDGCNRTKH